jgi:hypothetical protein
MAGMNKRLTSSNGILSGWPGWVNDCLRDELVSRIDAFMCTMFCIYQVYERTTIVMLWIENNISLVNDI